MNSMKFMVGSLPYRVPSWTGKLKGAVLLPKTLKRGSCRAFWGGAPPLITYRSSEELLPSSCLATMSN